MLQNSQPAEHRRRLFALLTQTEAESNEYLFTFITEQRVKLNFSKHKTAQTTPKKTVFD
jgi:hypothetical protein